MGTGSRRISSLAGSPYLMVPTKTGDGALMGHRTQGARLPPTHIHVHDIFRVASRADRRPYQRAHPYRRHLAIYLPRRHFCPSGEILGMSSERHHQDEIIRFDIGWAVIVSPSRWYAQLTNPDDRARVKPTDHVYGVQAVVYFHRP
jgi:hypothetical protein